MSTSWNEDLIHYLFQCIHNWLQYEYDAEVTDEKKKIACLFIYLFIYLFIRNNNGQSGYLLLRDSDTGIDVEAPSGISETKKADCSPHVMSRT